jgi:hypothetical protein
MAVTYESNVLLLSITRRGRLTVDAERFRGIGHRAASETVRWKFPLTLIVFSKMREMSIRCKMPVTSSPEMCSHCFDQARVSKAIK